MRTAAYHVYQLYMGGEGYGLGGYGPLVWMAPRGMVLEGGAALGDMIWGICRGRWEI